MNKELSFSSILYAGAAFGLLLWLLYEKLMGNMSNREYRSIQGPEIEESLPDGRQVDLGDASLPPLTDVSSSTSRTTVDLKKGNSHGTDGGPSKGEKICRQVVKELYRDSDIRYNVRGLTNLVNDMTNRSLEIDILLPDERIAIEYQGEQHYKSTRFNPDEPPDVLMTKPEINSQQHRDQIKAKWCQKHGIKLINVPYNYNTYDAIKSYILSEIGYY